MRIQWHVKQSPPSLVAARIQTRTSTGPCRSRSRSTGCVLHTCHPIPHTANRFPTPIDHQPTVPSTHSAPSAIVVTTMALGAERSEEHTSELQSRLHLVCRLLLEKKKKKDRE